MVTPEFLPGKGSPVSKRCLWSLQHLIRREGEEKEGGEKKTPPGKQRTFLSNDRFTTTALPSSLQKSWNNPIPVSSCVVSGANQLLLGGILHYPAPAGNQNSGFILSSPAGGTVQWALTAMRRCLHTSAKPLQAQGAAKVAGWQGGRPGRELTILWDAAGD